MRIKGFKCSFHKVTKVHANLACVNATMVYNIYTILKSKTFGVSLNYFLRVPRTKFHQLSELFPSSQLRRITQCIRYFIRPNHPGGLIYQYSSQTVCSASVQSASYTLS